MNIYEKWDKEINIKGLLEDVENADDNYGEVPHGEYEVSIEKMELSETKNGDPMVVTWFKIINGDNKGKMIFYNQVITKGFQIKIATKFLDSLGLGLDTSFKSYVQYNDLLMDIMELIKGKLEFALEYGENKKGFNTFKITEVFEVE